MIKKSSRLRGLRVQISLYFFISSIIVILLIAMVFYYSSESLILESQLKHTKSSVEQSGQYIEVYLNKLKAQANIIAKDGNTINYLKNKDYYSRDYVYGLIKNILETDSSFVSVTIVGKDGSLLSSEEGLDMSVSSDMMKESWYVNAIKSEMPVLTSARQQKFTMEKSTWVISISQEIKDTDSNIGVLLMDIKYQVIEDYLRNMDLGRAGYGFILNDSLDVVYHPDVSYFENDEKKDELIKISEMTFGYDEEMDMLIHSYQIKGSNWTLIGLSSLDELKFIRRQMIEILILASFLIALVVIGASWIVGIRISNPIKRLEIAMNNFDKDMKKFNIDKRDYNEVIGLGNHYNKMIDTIKKLMLEIKTNEKYLRNYEINALYSQINPHFLYNTLDTIVWMAEFNDSQKVVEVTKALANFFRLSLNSGKEKIPLKDEIEHVRQYLFIQKQRYGDELKYNIKFDRTLENIEIPKIILQPIVENALYHGIREKLGEGHIEIEVLDSEDKIIILVIDDGVGFNVGDSKKDKIKLGGIGLENVDKRLKLYYGENCGIKVDSIIGKGTTVRITIKKVEVS